jgi:hypothetical protein
MHSSHRDAPRHAAFTITELLIAISVLTLLTTFVAELVNNTRIITTNSHKHMDADDQSRLIFSRMAGDFSKMLRRSDVDYLFSKQNGNDKMFFYSEAPAFYDGSTTSFKPRSPVALLGYRINTNHQLERLGKLLNWSGSTSTQPGSVVFLTYPSPSVKAPKPTPQPASLLENNWPSTLGSAPDYNGSDADFHVLAEQACRLEFCFQMKDGTYSFDPSGDAATTVHSLKDVSAIVVALILLDPTSQKITDLGKVCDAFDDPAAGDLVATPPVLMAERWRRQLYRADFVQTSRIPQAAASQIRIYQRYFPLSLQ